MASQWPHLNDVKCRGIRRIGGDVQLLEVVAGDDEDDGGGAEGHLLLGSVPCAARPGHDDWPYGALGRRQGALFEAALRPGEPGAEQLHQTAPELRRRKSMREEMKGSISASDNFTPTYTIPADDKA